MARTVREVMVVDPFTCKPSPPVTYAAPLMRDQGISDVLIEDDNGLQRGIVTDRDIVVHRVVDERDAAQMPLTDVCSSKLVTVTADAAMASTPDPLDPSHPDPIVPPVPPAPPPPDPLVPPVPPVPPPPTPIEPPSPLV